MTCENTREQAAEQGVFVTEHPTEQPLPPPHNPPTSRNNRTACETPPNSPAPDPYTRAREPAAEQRASQPHRTARLETR